MPPCAALAAVFSRRAPVVSRHPWVPPPSSSSSSESVSSQRPESTCGAANTKGKNSTGLPVQSRSTVKSATTRRTLARPSAAGSRAGLSRLKTV
jgi:hypothetical protein